jgi:hypothetical protein
VWNVEEGGGGGWGWGEQVASTHTSLSPCPGLALQDHLTRLNKKPKPTPTPSPTPSATPKAGKAGGKGKGKGVPRGSGKGGKYTLADIKNLSSEQLKTLSADDFDFTAPSHAVDPDLQAAIDAMEAATKAEKAKAAKGGAAAGEEEVGTSGAGAGAGGEEDGAGGGSGSAEEQGGGGVGEEEAAYPKEEL